MSLNNFEVIDMHAHVYPDKIARKAAAGTDTFYGTTAAHDGTVLQFVSAMKEAGIDRAVIHSVATTYKQVESVNRFIAETAAQDPAHLTGLGTLHMDSPDLRKDVEEIVAAGLHGVKLHPDIQGFQVDSKWSEEVYSLMEEFDLPILLHTGDRRYDNSNPDRMRPMVEKYQNVTFIGAHFGGWSMWEEASRLLAGLPNFYVDCSSSFPYVSPEGAEKMIRLYGADHVMFGTDYPMWSPKDVLNTFMKLNLSDAEKRMILSENAKQIFRIGEIQL